MAFIPLLAAGGAAVSAIGALTGGIAAKNNANYQATISGNNAIVANQNAVYTEQAGAAAAENEGLKGAAKSGALKTAQAANGVNINNGSAVNVQTSEREANQLGTENVVANADLKAYGYRTQATGFEAEQGLQEAEADQALPEAGLKATGSLLSAASGLGGKWSGSSGWSGSTTPGPGFVSGL